MDTSFTAGEPRLRALVFAISIAFLVGTALLAAPLVTPAPLNTMDALPANWGSPVHVARSRPMLKKKALAADQLLPLAPPKRLSRLPNARVQVGQGRVDPAAAASVTGGAFCYTVKATAAGVVEYLYPKSGVVSAGKPLVRLYDLAILADLKIGESAMARFASSPFVIAPASSTLPPLPPGVDFPQPTADARGLGIRLAAPLETPAAAATNALPALLPESIHRSGLSLASGLAPAPRGAGLTAAPAPEPRASSSLPDLTELTGQLSDSHQQLEQLSGLLSRIDDQQAAARERLEQAKVDAASSERLYNQGVLARNVWEATQAKVRTAQQQIEDLQQKRQEAVAQRERLQGRVASLQGKVDDAVAERGRAAAAEINQAPAAPERRPAINERQSKARVLVHMTPRQPQPTAGAVPNMFPSPTAPRRPEVARLPRTPLSAVHLRPSAEIPAVPEAVKRLAAPRWQDVPAPSEGAVMRQLVPAGTPVQPGTPLLEVANREWARVYADVSREQISQFPNGAPVSVSFEDYPGVTLRGWINGTHPVAHQDLAQVEMVVLCHDGYYPDDTYASLQWLALAAPLETDKKAEPLTPAVETRTALQAGEAQVYEVLPLVPPTVGPAQAPVSEAQPGAFTGVLRLAEMDANAAPQAKEKPAQTQRLAMLKQWRESFVEGMTTSLFGGLLLTYPREGDVARAVERMASGDVSHDYNRCARTVREALGWGLGDAAVWMTRLPERGFQPRKDGLARPGDILVWPFTYGSRHTQHIGLAVSQNGKLMLLSNLGGTLGTSELVGGYVAFYKPTTSEPAKATVKTAAKRH